MKRIIVWIWNRGVVSTFLTGFFTMLPFVITIAIMVWMGSTLQRWVGPKAQQAWRCARSVCGL